MARQVLADTCASISEFKRNPCAVVAQGKGYPVAVLNRNEPVFYCVPADVWEALMDRLEKIELNAIVVMRQNQQAIEVNLDDL